MDYSDLNKVNIFFSDVKKIVIGLLLGFFVMLFFRGCNPEISTTVPVMTKNEKDKQEQLVNDYKHKFEESTIKTNKLILKLDSARAIALLSKQKLYQLQRQQKRPAHVANLVDCNDTIQKVYDFAIKKDSACNSAIVNLDNEIFTQDSINDNLNKEQKILLNSILVKDNLLNNSEKANLNLEKDKNDLTNSVKQESNKKNFWKTTAAAAGLEILRRIIFK